MTAEPWLGNRYAQNCAGCHAPGRKNLPPIDRRCTLSCQGCHVNPSGGGMRSFYGRWNQDRWLRSFRLPGEKATASTAPIGKQRYGKRVFEKYERSKKRRDKVIIEQGYPHIEDPVTYADESKYTRKDRLEFITAEDELEFLYQVPQQDPYRLFDYTRTDAGGDIRYLWRQLQGESNSSEAVSDSAPEWQSFFMSADLGIRYRPVHRNFHLVYEGRIFGNPAEGTSKREVLKTAGTRSLYAMVDNLPYNVYVMGGWYRPLINATTPDHDSLGEKMLASALTGTPRSQSLLFNAVSVGTAPNVPFANLHFIRRKKFIGGDFEGDQTTGYAANVGLRFVTLGIAVNSTYWKTNDDNETTQEQTTTEIVGFGVSGMIGPFLPSLELLSFARDQANTDFRRGGLWSLKTRTQLWRENYFILHYAQGSTTVSLLPGSSSQLKVGLRSFHIAGLGTTISYDLDEETSDGEKGTTANSRKTAYLTGQLHFYF